MIDAHVHLFPDRLFDALWSWFEQHAWHVHERLYADQALDRLEQDGASHVVALIYAHRPEMAADLNGWLGALARRRPSVIPSATAHPRDRDVKGLLTAARDQHGARLVKQHCHVLAIAPDDPLMFPLYEACIELNLPLVLHAGNGPSLEGYGASTDDVSGAARTVAVLERYPELRLVIPHLGAMEESAFFALLDRYPNLYLDTTMAMVPAVPGMRMGDRSALAHYPGRILFGTDFPNIPFPLDTERRALEALQLEAPVAQELFHHAAARLFGVDSPEP